MYEVRNDGLHPNFPECWTAAGTHLQNQVQGKISWLRADLNSPSLEHLSFRMGNQLFFIRLGDSDGRVTGPGSLEGLLTIAHGCKGVPCVMPMHCRNGHWKTAAPGWGLVHAETGTPVEPVSLVTDEKVEMTDWELHDFAVQVIRDTLRAQGKKITSTQGNPSVDPSIWMDGGHGPEYVVVRTACYPAPPPELPKNIGAIIEACRKLSNHGHFAPVVIANSDDPFGTNGKGALPLWRGHGMLVRFEGLRAL